MCCRCLCSCEWALLLSHLLLTQLFHISVSRPSLSDLPIRTLRLRAGTVHANVFAPHHWQRDLTGLYML